LTATAHRAKLLPMKRLSILLALAAVAAACSDDDTPAGRPYKGGVTIVEGGTNNVPLTFAAGSPQATIESQLYLAVSGSAGAASYEITLLIDPTKPPPARYELPRDASLLSATLKRDGQPVGLGSPQGFIEIKARDSDPGGGSAVFSTTLTDASNLPLAEIDLIFSGS